MSGDLATPELGAGPAFQKPIDEANVVIAPMVAAGHGTFAFPYTDGSPVEFTPSVTAPYCFELWGGGGGGGGGNAGDANGGGGGASGGYTRIWLDLTAGTSVFVTVGGGGDGGAVGDDAVAGGNTVVEDGLSVEIGRANGGTGGYNDGTACPAPSTTGLPATNAPVLMRGATGAARTDGGNGGSLGYGGAGGSGTGSGGAKNGYNAGGGAGGGTQNEAGGNGANGFACVMW